MAYLPQFEVYRDASGQYRWRLRAANGQIVATSGEGYIHPLGAKIAVNTVKTLAPIATVEDLTVRRTLTG